MKLYINTNEVPFLKDALSEAIERARTPIVADRLGDLYERVVLCEALQKSQRKAKREEAVSLMNQHFGDVKTELSSLCDIRKN